MMNPMRTPATDAFLRAYRDPGGGIPSRCREEAVELPRIRRPSASIDRASRLSGIAGFSLSSRPPSATSSVSSRPPSASTATVTRVGGTSSKTCDRCDGPHLTESCPIYKKPREDHPDAWRNLGRKKPLEMGKGGGNVRVSGSVVRQPGDGSCLFHSMAYGIGGTSAHSLRREIANFIERNPNLEVAGDALSDWVKWDTGSSVASYARRMAGGAWGGGIEMASACMLKNVNIHVYERSGGAFKRISCFEPPSGVGRKTVHVLYGGRCHYDALVPSSRL
eukprot:CAMPEP_0114552650 /NCGR_PEP_ID=MMETSP0114-20121206/7236_1 /TAXON_ID=31324 /ORGANISM="Goniomonas sp, Strain m" /LENGTH=277 /DNA_ID=CAMNT_0001737537 /DNA_START=55 /DNA_END=888 /DNA_ORIENTATION=+